MQKYYELCRPLSFLNSLCWPNVLQMSHSVSNKTLTHRWNSGLEYMKRAIPYLSCKFRKISNIDTDLSVVLNKAWAKFKLMMTQAKEEAFASSINCSEAWGKPYKLLIKTRLRVCVPEDIKNSDGITLTSKDKTIHFLQNDKFRIRNPDIGSLIPTVSDDEFFNIPTYTQVYCR